MKTNSKPRAVASMALLLAAGLLPLLSILPAATAQGTSVPVTAVDWLDLDHNGHLDAATLTVSCTPAPCPGPSLDTNVYPSDFTINLGGLSIVATGYSTHACTWPLGGCDPAAPPTAGEVSDGRFTIFFPEGNALDAGAASGSINFVAPSITFTPHQGGPTLSFAGATRTDRAPPILKAAYTRGGSASINVVFSEAVSRASGVPNTACNTGPTFCFPASPSAPSPDFCFVDAAGAVRPITTITPQGGQYPARSFTMTVGATTTVTPPNPPGGAPYYPSYSISTADAEVGSLASHDVANYPGFLLAAPFVAGAGNSGDNDCGALAATYVDRAGNAGVQPFCPFCTPATPQAPWDQWPIGAVPVGGPIPVWVHASKGDTRVVVEFTGPVADCQGNPLTSGFATQNAPGAPQANWQVSTVFQASSALGSDRVWITSTVPLPDLTSNLVTQHQAIYAPNSVCGGNSPNTPNISWQLTDGPVTLERNANYLNRRAGPGFGGASLSAPRIVSMETVDGDTNGCVDAIKITFNEDMDDGGGTVMAPILNNVRGAAATDPHPEYHVTATTLDNGDTNTIRLVGATVATGWVGDKVNVLTGLYAGQYSITSVNTGANSIDISPAVASPGFTDGGDRVQIVRALGTGTTSTLVDPNADFLAAEVRVGHLLEVVAPDRPKEFYRILGVTGTQITFGDWNTGEPAPAGSAPDAGDIYRISRPLPLGTSGWTVFWPGSALTLDPNNPTLGIDVVAAQPITGGAGISGNSRIHYSPDGLNDRILFLTFPAQPAVSNGYAPADTNVVPLDLGTYGGTNCRPTGAMSPSVQNEWQLPRVSYCANSPGSGTGYIRDGENPSQVGFPTTARTCPGRGQRPVDLAGNELQFGVIPLLPGGGNAAGAPFMYRSLTRDAAPPVVIGARTRDCATSLLCPSRFGEAENYNGRIDNVQLDFSEPISDQGVAVTGWFAEAKRPCTTTGALPRGDGLYPASGSLVSLDGAGRVRLMRLSEVPSTFGHDTGCILDVRVANPGVRDLSGQCEASPNSFGACHMLPLERGPRFAGELPALAKGATSFTHAAFVAAVRDFCTPLASDPNVRTCSPPLTFQIQSTLAAGLYQVTQFNTQTNVVTFAAVGGVGGTPQASVEPGGVGATPVPSLFALVRSASEGDGAGPVVLEDGLLGTLGSTYAQAVLSERACAWRGTLADVTGGTRTTLVAAGVDLSFFQPGIPLVITGNNNAVGSYKVTAVLGNTLHFAPAAPAVVTSDNRFILGCQPVQAADFAYRDNNGSGTAIIGVPQRSPPDHKLDLTLAPSSGLMQGDVGSPADPIRDCLQLKIPTTPGLYSLGNTFAVTDMSSNIPHPEQTGSGTPCRYWQTAQAPSYVSGETTDSNKDGYLDAIRITVSEPIADGTRLLRRDGGTLNTADASDGIYFDMDPVGNPNLGRISTGDIRLTPFATYAAFSTVSCPTGGTPDTDCGSPDPSYPVLWQDVGTQLTVKPSYSATDFAGDGLWADVDSSGSVSQGDFRYFAQAGYPAGGTALCPAAGSPPTYDRDCVRAIASTQSPCPTGVLCYQDTDRNGWVSQGDVRTAAVPATTAGPVACDGASPHPDCGSGYTPTTVNLAAADFDLRFGGTSNKAAVVTCVVTGKGPGPLLGGPFSSCPAGVTGVPDPAGGTKPAITDSCAGALPSFANDAILYVCFLWVGEGVVTLPEAIPNTGHRPKIHYTPSTARVGGTIRAIATDLPLGGFFGNNARDATDNAAPVLVEVLGDPTSPIVQLVFSEPVARAAKSTEAISREHLQYVNGNAGTAYCPSGAGQFNATFTTSSPTITIPPHGRGEQGYPFQLDGRPTHEDVVGCIQNPLPASQVASRDGIRPAAGAVYEYNCDPAARPEGTCVAVSTKTVPLRDQGKPRIDAASFVDANGDGTIDAVKVTFSEPVNDCFMSATFPGAPTPGPIRPDNGQNPAFPIGPVNCGTPPQPCNSASNPTGCMDPTHQYGWAPHLGDFTVKVEVGGTKYQLTPRAIVTGQLGAEGPFASQELCRASYPSGPALRLHAGPTAPTFGPLDGFNDNTVFICLNPDARPWDGGRGTRGIGTGVTGTFLYTAAGTSCGNPTVPASGRAVCDIADIGPDAAFTSPANPMGSMATTPEFILGDRAEPIVASVRTDDRDRDGKVDSVRLNFTEKVNAVTLTRNDWSIEGRTVTGFALPENPAECVATVAGSPPATHIDRVWLCFDEVTGASTFDTNLGRTPGTGPRVSYATGGSVRDLATCPRSGLPQPCTNAMPGMVPTPASDGAPPVVVRVQADQGATTATITFSEPVDGSGDPNNPSLSIGTRDLTYQDNSPGGASAITNQIVHSPGDLAAAISLNAPVTAADLQRDQICFTGTIREHGGGLFLLDPCVPLNGVLGNRAPPPPPRNLVATVNGDVVRLEWDTPNDPAIATVQLYVCFAGGGCDLTEQNIRTGSGPVCVFANLPTCTPRPARLGERETHEYRPQPPGSWPPHKFVAVTFTSSGVMSTVSNEVLATRSDTTKPGAIGQLSADPSSPAGDRVRLTFTAPSDAGQPVFGYRVYLVEGPGPVTKADATRVSGSNVVSGSIAPPGSTQTITLTGLRRDTQYTVGVAAFDAADNEADNLAMATFTTVATRDPLTTTTTTTSPPAFSVADRNEEIEGSVDVEPNGNGTGMVVTWELPDEDASKPTQGVQVWKCPSGKAPCTLLATLPAGSPEFVARSYVDPDGTASDGYIVTAYYGSTTADGKAATSDDAAVIPGFNDLKPTTAGGRTDDLLGLPLWLWLVIGLGAVLLIGLVVLLLTRGRRGAGDEWAPAAEGEAPPPGEEGVPVQQAETVGPGAMPPPDTEAAAAPMAPAQESARKSSMTHYVTCPKCSTEFSATGPKPLAIQCPNCGVRGTLR